MPNTVELQVQLVAKTEFLPPADVPWSTDTDGGLALAEFAGRACYQSWSKPNPATATNRGYIAHILEVGHYSVLEHGQLSVYLTGLPRSVTHEVVRHRHFSYSQLSQRYVPVDEDTAFVEPAAVAADPVAHLAWTAAIEACVVANRTIRTQLEGHYGAIKGLDRTTSRKLPRQAARSVLPNAAETRLVMTGNYRAWRHFIKMRGSEHADVEIREVAIAILRLMQREVPAIVDDFEVFDAPVPGTPPVAVSPFAVDDE